MADILQGEPLTEDAFLRDRLQFWQSFLHVAMGCAAGVAVLLIGMAIFLT